MAEAKTNAMRILDKNAIPYKIHTYESAVALDGVTVAAKIGVAADAAYKTLVTEGSDRNYYVFVIPVQRELSLKKAAQRAGVKSVAMLRMDALKQITGYVRGGCSPVGMKKPFFTVVDESAALRESIVVSGGRIGLMLELSPAALAEQIGCGFGDLCI